MPGIVDRGSTDRIETESELERRRDESSSLVSEGARRGAAVADLEDERARARAFAESIGEAAPAAATSTEGGRRALKRTLRKKGAVGPLADLSGKQTAGTSDCGPAPFGPAPDHTIQTGPSAPLSASVWQPGASVAPDAPETAAGAPGHGSSRHHAGVPAGEPAPASSDSTPLRVDVDAASSAPHDRAHKVVETAWEGARGSARAQGWDSSSPDTLNSLANDRPVSLEGASLSSSPLGDALAPAAARLGELGGAIGDSARRSLATTLENAALSTFDSAVSGGRELRSRDVGGYVGDSARDAAHTFRTSLSSGMSLRAATASAAVAALWSDELKEADAAIRRGAFMGRAGHRIWGALRGAGRDEAASRIKHTYSKRLISSISQKRAASEVITGQGAALRAESTVRALGATASVASKGSGLLTWLGGIAVVALIFLLLFFMLIGGAAGGDQQIEGLGPYASQMAQYLRDAGWDDVHVAAAVGNAIYESGGDQQALEIDPAHEGDLSGVGNYGYEVNCGIFSWTDVSPGFGVMTTMKTYAQMNGRDWRDLEIQLDFFLQVYLPGRSSAAVDRWFAISDLDDATLVMVSPSGGILSGWAGAVQGQAREDRLDLAHRVYAAITNGGSGEEYEASSDVQKAIVDAAKRVPSPGSGLCAGWVSQVYVAAGLGPVYGNADDMYYAYCTSSDRSQLKVGMLIGTPSNPYSIASLIYGHVGIYIGDGLVMSNLSGTITTQTLDDFIAVQGVTHQVRWGFPPNVNV